MEFLSIEKLIKYSLQHVFEKIEVKPLVVDTNLINKHRLESFPHRNIKAVSFFLDDSVRYIMFYMDVRGETLFTRPKSGILIKLTQELRSSDFRNTLTEDFTEYESVMGIFLEHYINQKAEEDIRIFLERLVTRQKEKTGKEHKYTTGYHVIKHNKETMDYQAIFEVFVKSPDQGDDEFVGYSGEISSGVPATFVNRQKDGMKTTLMDVFS
ncbi:hypothetical protein CF8_0014 [Aeromonas phage CF8]|nr:hypothetical protein CF8_0014 [Aeromonas phage CF8]